MGGGGGELNQFGFLGLLTFRAEKQGCTNSHTRRELKAQNGGDTASLA